MSDAPAQSNAGRTRRDVSWALVIAVALFLWHLPAFTLMPAINHDEIMLNAAARNWTARGVIALSPLADKGATYGSAYYWHPPGYLLLVAAAYERFGFSIAVTRGVSLVSGAVAIALLFLLARRLGLTRPMALATSLLFAAHPLVWWLCRSGRMDLVAIACGLGALLLVVRDDRDEIAAGRAVAAGLLIGIGALFHLMALAWAPAVAAAEIGRVGRGTRRYRTALAIGAAAALLVVLWLAWVFASGDGPAWKEQFLRYQLEQRSAASPLWRRVPDELYLACRQFEFVPLVLGVVLGGVACGWKNVGPLRRWAAGGAAMAFLAIAFVCAKGPGVYPLYWYVWVLLAGAMGLAALPRRVRLILLAAALGNAVLAQGAYAAIGLYQRHARDPQRVDRFFAAHLKPGAIVAGPEDIWYAVEHAGAQLRIWAQPNPARYDYFVTYGNIPPVPPAGYTLVAVLPDTMPKVFGHYFSATAYSYRLWAAQRPIGPTAASGAK